MLYSAKYWQWKSSTEDYVGETNVLAIWHLLQIKDIIDKNVGK